MALLRCALLHHDLLNLHSSRVQVPVIRVVPIGTVYLELHNTWKDHSTHFYSTFFSRDKVLGFFAYSLVYMEHKSWYSYFLSSAVGVVYTFGSLLCFAIHLVNSITW